jgi:hypothetical protein
MIGDKSDRATTFNAMNHFYAEILEFYHASKQLYDPFYMNK